jgi:hypothetical protein
MKVVKIKKHDDYVRFSFTIDTENGKGLEFKTQVCGGITKNKIGKISFINIEDMDFETEFKVFGEYTDYRKFQEFYKNLYGIEQHTKLIQKIEDTCQEVILQKYPRSFDNLSIEHKKEMLIELIGYDKKKKSWGDNLKSTVTNMKDIKMGEDIKVYFTSNYWVREIFKSIPGFETRLKNFTWNDRKIKGAEIHDVLHLIENN